MGNGEKKIIPIELLNEARQSLRNTPIINSPLIPLNINIEGKKIYLKCENLQPYGSFKIRGACFAMQKLTDDQRAVGVCSASAGNFGQGLGYMSKRFGCPCTILVPKTIPKTKLDRIVAQDVSVIKAPFEEWWSTMVGGSHRGFDAGATFIHPLHRNVMAGHGTIGLEILEHLLDVDTIICPFGSGGLITGVASVVKQMKPNVKVLACEPDVATPLKYSFEMGKASVLKEHQSSFVDGMGGKQVMDEIWPYVSHLVSGSVTVSLQQIVDAIRLLIDRASLVVEGAGAAPVSAALTDQVTDGNIVCVLSGGNIDFHKLEAICRGQVPL